MKAKSCKNCGAILEKGERNICYGCKEDLQAYDNEIKLKKEMGLSPSPCPNVKGQGSI